MQITAASFAVFAISFAAAFTLADEPEIVEVPEDAEILFDDRFDGELDDAWRWLRENPDYWRFSDGRPGLEIRVVPGKADSVRNALLRDAPDRRQTAYAFEVTVENLTPPIQQWEQAGLVFYHDGRPVTKVVKEFLDGEPQVIPAFQVVPDVPIRLRMEIRGNRFRSLYRVLGDHDHDAQERFRLAGEGDLPPAGSDGDALSLQCYDGPPNAEHWMRFTNFQILELPD